MYTRGIKFTPERTSVTKRLLHNTVPFNLRRSVLWYSRYLTSKHLVLFSVTPPPPPLPDKLFVYHKL
jgi:hypothetical protein